MKAIFLVLLIISNVSVLSMCYAMDASQAQNVQILQQRVRNQKQLLQDTLNTIEDKQLLDALQTIKAQWAMLSFKLGIRRLIDELKDVLQQECNTIASDKIIQQYSERSSYIAQQLKDYQQSSLYKQIAEKEALLQTLRSSPVLSYEQGKAVEKLQSEISSMIPSTIKALMQESKGIDEAISRRLKPLTQKIVALGSQIKLIARTNPHILTLQQHIQDFKNTFGSNSSLQVIDTKVTTIINDIRSLINQLNSYQQACVELSPGLFVSQAQFLNTLNQDIVAILLDTQDKHE